MTQPLLEMPNTTQPAIEGEVQTTSSKSRLFSIIASALALGTLSNWLTDTGAQMLFLTL